MLSLALMLQVVAVNAADTIFDPQGDDEYRLVFTNDQGLTYNVPFATNEYGILKYGTNDRDLVFMEGNVLSNASALDQDFTIGHLDYFVLTGGVNSHVMRYANYDAQNNELRFEDLATGDVKLVTFARSNIDGVLGEGDLIAGGVTYKVYVANASSGIPPLAIDQNSNGEVNYNEVFIQLESGELLDIGYAGYGVGGTWDGNTSTWNNTGAVIISPWIEQTRLFTWRDTFGSGLPFNTEIVEFHMRRAAYNGIDIISVVGTGFNLSSTNSFTTYYGETFDYFKKAYEPATVRVIPPSNDTTSPEFIVRLTNKTKDFTVTYEDDSNGPLTSSVAGMSLWNGYELLMYDVEDQAGNSAQMELVYNKRDKNSASVHVLSLGYNREPALDLVSNEFSARFNDGKIIQELTVLPDYEVTVTYNTETDTGKLVYRDANNWNGFGVDGYLFLKLQTNQGVLEYGTLTP